MKYLIPFLAAQALFPILLCAQQPLSGIYTIGGASPDFATTQAAVDALAQNGVGGPVVFNFRPGTYGGMTLFNSIAGTSAQNTVVFQAETLDSTSVKITGSSLPLVRLRDQRHFQFRHLTIQPNASSTQASAFFAEFCDDITIDHCYVQYNGPNAGGNDNAAVEFGHRYDGAATTCRLLNTTLTGTATCVYTSGGKGHTIVSGCRLNSSGPYSLQSRYQGTLTLSQNSVPKKVNVSFCDAIYLQQNVLEDEVDLGSVVKLARGNRFLSTSGLDINYVAQFDSNYVAGYAFMNGNTITRNRFAAEVHFSHSDNTVFRQNQAEAFASFAFCDNLTLNRNEFKEDVDIAFCDNSRMIANLFHRYCGIGICHGVQILNNNFGPAAIFDFASYEARISNNIFSRELEGDGRLFSPGVVISGNNYYPAGGQYDSAPSFIPPDYPDSSVLRPENPLLIGKCGWNSSLIGVDFDGRARPAPATLGAFELCLSPGETVEVPCGDALRLSLCQMPASGQWHWTPAEGLDDPHAQRPFARPVADTRYVVTDSLSGWSDTLWIRTMPYHSDLPDTLNILCGNSVLLSPQTHNGATYTWSPPTGLSGAQSAHPLASPEAPVTYFLELAAPGCAPFTDSVFIDVDPRPRAFAAYDQNGNAVQFFNYSTCADSYYWDFGDGQSSTEFEPAYMYADTGQYPIFLAVANDAGSDTIFGTITVWFTISAPDNAHEPTLHVFPNPFSDVLYLELPEAAASPVDVVLIDALGRGCQTGSENTGGKMLRFKIPPLPSGFYVAQFRNAGQVFGSAKLFRAAIH